MHWFRLTNSQTLWERNPAFLGVYVPHLKHYFIYDVTPSARKCVLPRRLHAEPAFGYPHSTGFGSRVEIPVIKSAISDETIHIYQFFR